ncbi:membrane protein insertase YidC [Sulfurimonas paralvinellae]|uniref:Membrane protein insertase YidC n=1 Tax=Sulfurimonas paralvinellae TaxID=317658 RepID=A0A7M1B9B9_9BACT|nr:membrane protein insertase YidC [Sulfurimonas paralvinellae]QOP46231.1 membrane protein insertase YidC [Sulfurimonas paralvinellae]
MLDKMTPNQRLIVAVLLSVVFFVGYTAIFPPAEPNTAEKSSQTEVAQSAKQDISKKVEEVAGHAIAAEEKASNTTSSDIVTVTSEKFVLKIDTLGRIASKELLEDKFRNDEDLHAQVIPSEGTKPLYIRFADDAINDAAIRTPYMADISDVQVKDQPVTVTLTQKLPSLTVTKVLTFYADGHYDAKISLSKDVRHFVYLGDRPQVSKKLMAVAGALIYTGDDVAHIIEDGDAEGRQIFQDVKLASSFDQYTAIILYGFKKDTNVIVERGRDDNPVVYFDAAQNENIHGYIGPKEHKVLKAIDPVLTNAIEYGWFTFAAKPLFALLSWLHGIFGNWGWAIIALTFIIRAVLYPLTYKGMVSMQKMKTLAPKLKELKEKYGKDPQKLNAMTMEMYKKHGANPLGGCLPMLLQIPVFFALYRTLLNAVELQGAPWILWINDLSRMDPYYVLPILMGASMFIQQRMTPNNFTDPMQEKVFKYLPVIFTFFFVTFPSGLVLYWFTNNLFSIAQQYMVNQQFKNAEDAKAAIEKKSEK